MGIIISYAIIWCAIKSKTAPKSVYFFNFYLRSVGKEFSCKPNQRLLIRRP